MQHQVDINLFYPEKNPKGIPVVLLPSRFLWDKGIGEFVESAKILKEQGRAKVIMSFAMFYDLHDPIKFLNQITTILENDGVLALEFSYMPLMLKNLTYDQICHEHLIYYSFVEVLFKD